MIWVIHPLKSHGYNKKRLAVFGKSYMSGKRGSNPRPPAWKASALSTELFPQFHYLAFSRLSMSVGKDGFEPPKA